MDLPLTKEEMYNLIAFQDIGTMLLLKIGPNHTEEWSLVNKYYGQWCPLDSPWNGVSDLELAERLWALGSDLLWTFL